MAEAMLSDSKFRWAAPVLGTLMGLLMRRHHDRFSSDVMVEADAEMALDARPVLPRIQVPVLLIAGDEDPFVSAPLINETARLIPECTLKLYEGKGHEGAIMSNRLAPDILDYISQTSAPAT
jgi:pimeloyl-ACP methyl ester carboxylesterase